MKKNYIIIHLLLFSIVGTSCKKYLDAKPSGNLSTPQSVADLQGILDDNLYMNQKSSSAGDVATDDYYLNDTSYNALPNIQSRNAYLWQTDIFSGTATDWNLEYTVAYRANIVLENLLNIPRNNSNSVAWDNCKGQALLFRAKTFFECAQIWAKAYNTTTANTDLGIALKLTSDYNSATTRASIQQSYQQIISDLKQAIPLLPNHPVFVFRPSKPAAYGYLARTYLAMRDYVNAGLYADSCLQLSNELLDYNTINAASPFPFLAFRYTNPEEVMFSYETITNESVFYTYATVDSTLFKSFAANDLRRSIYFQQRADGTNYFKGSYFLIVPFNGVCTDEMYLTRAECEARAGDTKDAMNDLNTLLVKRWVTNMFVPYTATSATDALNQVLMERRKELIDRGLRFTDIKRLNQEGANIIQTHIIGGKTYTLKPNDPKYALPIPINVIQLTGIPRIPVIDK